MISNFVPLNLRVETIHGSRPDFTLLDRSIATDIEIFSGHAYALWKRRKEFFFFGGGVGRVNVDLVNPARWP